MAPRKATSKEPSQGPQQDGSEVDLDAERREMIARNATMLAALGVQNAARNARQAIAEEKKRVQEARPPTQTAKKPRASIQPRESLRRSTRLQGVPAAPMAELDDDDRPVRTASAAEDGESSGLVDLLVGLECRGEPREEGEEGAGKQQFGGSKFNQRVHCKVRGLCCHYCRQKILCDEPECPRCTTTKPLLCPARGNAPSDPEEACIGKTSCPKCSSDKGVFCRWCLLSRFGQRLSEVRNDPTWRCPHCIEEEATWPSENFGWMCNASNCLPRKGYRPTGIAVHIAHRYGFPGVAQLLQHQIRKRREAQEAAAAAKAAAAAASAPAEAEAAAELAEAEEAVAKVADMAAVPAPADSPLALCPKWVAVGRRNVALRRRGSQLPQQQQRQQLVKEGARKARKARGGREQGQDGEQVSGHASPQGVAVAGAALEV